MSNSFKNETESIFKGLEKSYGILYMLLLAFIIFLGARYVSTLDYNNLYYAPGLLAADTTMRVELPVKKGTTTPPIDILKFTTTDQALIDQGKGIYTSNCASCHGETGAGNGAAGAALNPPPRNFVDINAQQWKIGKKITEMYVTLEEGIAGTGMASFSNLTPEERFAVIQYIHTFSKEYPKDGPDDIAKLDEKYSLSKGVKAANQIPLNVAMDLEVLDYDTLGRNLSEVLKTVKSDNSNSAAAEFLSIVNDPQMALNSLASNSAWMEGGDAFVKYLSIDPVNKGFKAVAFYADREKLSIVQQYLSGLFSKYKS